MSVVATMEFKVVAIATVVMLAVVTIGEVQGQEDDYTDPIKCFYCFGQAHNSTCADPVHPKEDKGKSLHVIECESGICLKWTHTYDNVLYMHRTCSHRLKDFNIMMIDGVCRSERDGKGYLCMCGKHLCNSTETLHSVNTGVLTLCSIILLLLFYGQRGQIAQW